MHGVTHSPDGGRGGLMGVAGLKMRRQVFVLTVDVESVRVFLRVRPSYLPYVNVGACMLLTVRRSLVRHPASLHLMLLTDDFIFRLKHITVTASGSHSACSLKLINRLVIWQRQRQTTFYFQLFNYENFFVLFESRTHQCKVYNRRFHNFLKFSWQNDW